MLRFYPLALKNLVVNCFAISDNLSSVHNIFNEEFDSLSFGYMLSPVKFSAHCHSTSELLRTLLMNGCF